MSEKVRTAKFALEETVVFWDALAKTGLKKFYLVFHKSGKFKRFDGYHSECPLCEFTKQYGNDPSADCSKCPVNWEVYKTDNYSDFYTDRDSSALIGRCQHDSSPYYRWEQADTDTERADLAREVCDLVTKTLNDLLVNMRGKE